MKKYSLYLALLFLEIFLCLLGTNKVKGESLVELRGLGNRCLDIYQGIVKDGTPLVLNTCNNSFNQKWFISDGTIKHSSGKCMDINNAKSYDGSLIVLWNCENTKSQTWYISNETIEGMENKCVDVYRSWSEDGALIVL